MILMGKMERKTVKSFTGILHAGRCWMVYHPHFDMKAKSLSTYLAVSGGPVGGVCFNWPVLSA